MTIHSNKVIIMEGLPASGKTSLSNYLRDRHGFVKINESLGKIGAINTTNQKIVYAETLSKYAKAKQQSEPVIIDRGYPSMLAWDYCAQKMGYANDLAEKKEWVNNSIELGELFEPLLYVYLLVDPKESLARRPRECSKLDVWSGLEGMQYCTDYYNHFFENHMFNTLIINSSQPFGVIHKILTDKLAEIL